MKMLISKYRITNIYNAGMLDDFVTEVVMKTLRTDIIGYMLSANVFSIKYQNITP